MMKTLVTIGPQSVDTNTLKMLATKTNLFRLNGSHGTIDWHRTAIDAIRTACPDAFILMDIPGIKPRTNNNEAIFIDKDEEVIFGKGLNNDQRRVVELTKQLPKFSNKLEKFSVNDGQFEFDYVGSGAGYIIGRSKSAFKLLEKKGINLPKSKYNEDKQLEIYHNFLNTIDNLDIDGLGLSFVQTGELIRLIRERTRDLVLVAKIENSEGLKNCTDIVQNSDAIMIDRGDLGAEIGFNHLYNAINVISDTTKAHGKPLVMATENLESMIDRDVPSKSEVMSIAHSASIGVDVIMLSEETATATNAIDTVAWLTDFLAKCSRSNQPKTENSVKYKFSSIWESIASLKQVPCIIATKSGYALFEYFSVAPEADAILITQNKRLKKISHLYANKIDIISADLGDTPSETLWSVISDNREWLFKNRKNLAAIYVSKYVKSARANSITIFNRSDFDH